MIDDNFDFDEHPENFYIIDEMVNENQSNSSKSESCCSVLLIIAILAILITIA